LARQAGLTLANTRDKQIISALIAAGCVAPLASDPRGIAIANMPAPKVVSTATSAIGVAVSACTDTVGLEILQQIENYLVFMQEQNYPIQTVYCAVPPKVFQVIRAMGVPRATTAFANKPLFTAGDDYGGAGASIAVGMNMLTDSLDYMGVKIIKTNHIPRTDLAVGQAKYNLTVATGGVDIFGVIFQPEAVAGLSLMGMKVDTVQDVRRNTQFTVASMLKGTGVIRPELCQLLVGTTSVAAANTAAEIDTRLLVATQLGVTSGFGAEYLVTV
jgi:hypothetical protein